MFREGEYRDKKWKNIQVGEVVKIFANETVPCNIVLLSTSDPSGVCYVETLNLDGESNLKIRFARNECMNDNQEGRSVKGTVVCELFSDKTGTVTENKMEFYSASIGGIDYSADPGVISADFWKPADTQVLESGMLDSALERLLAYPTVSPARDLVSDYSLSWRHVIILCPQR